MKLSEFYKNETFSRFIDGIEVSRNCIKTNNGELYVDEERDLYYREKSSSSSALVRSDVGEWIYFNDNKIVCSYDDSPFDSSYICIVDIRGNHIASGVINLFGLTYTRDKKVVNETPEQEEHIIFELDNNSQPVFFNDKSFTTVHCYPHSDFFYTKFYDYDGNYLEAETRSYFVQMVLRDLIYGFIKHIPTKDGAFDLTNKQMDKFKMLEKIRFDTRAAQVNIELIDHIIEIIEEIGYVNKYAVKGYRIIRKNLIKHDLKDNLILPLLNVMVIERSGDFGRISSKWISITNAERIEQIAKKFKGEFKNILYDIELLWNAMRAVSQK